ncbi:Aste57867_19543 [Aphanomyces stellatus]|uniref:Aste57867_19543 protein n=1 Tax=Aphanomyces stellatus TaxID=120398 RepID=A0A485LE42_9STRA|nr:hypothetical protein As57867_019479 [Aphanomyces stellatus]VFT96250.1 Aste57867_19543 [Aphanomyces stellatus]
MPSLTPTCLSRHHLSRGTSAPHTDCLYEEASRLSPTLVRGFSNGNISVVDRHSWLEVCDKKHRYGANLQAYYKLWKQCGSPKRDFFSWLDADDGQVEVEGLPRTTLERETVQYFDKTERQKFALAIRDGRLVTRWNDVPVDTGDEPWIFVLRDGVLYASEKVTHAAPRIHHTSLVGGECVQAAGMMVVSNGVLKTVYPHSGHYRPSEMEVLALLRFLAASGIDLARVQVDVQRLQKLSRDVVNGKKVKKIDNAFFWPGDTTLAFLHHKERACIADLLHSIERAAHRR